MFYIIYKTTNKINDMFYIGAHKTANFDDGYLGSGDRLRYAVRKYGHENFERKVLHIFDTPAEMYAREAELVNEELLNDIACYNLKLGGLGGITKDARRKGVETLKHRLRTEESFKEKYAAVACSNLAKCRINLFRDPEFQKEMNKRAKTSRSIEKRKMTYDRIQHQVGSNNSQFGSFWITDGIYNKKCRTEIPSGWRRGRVIRK